MRSRSSLNPSSLNPSSLSSSSLNPSSLTPRALLAARAPAFTALLGVVAACAAIGCKSGPPARLDAPPTAKSESPEPAPPTPAAGWSSDSAQGVALQAFSNPQDDSDVPTHTCQGALHALRQAQVEASRQAEAFTQWTNTALALTFNNMLADFWPAWISRYEGFAAPRQRADFVSEDSYRAWQCGHSFYQYLAPLSDCWQGGGGPCSASPRLVVDDVFGVAFPEPANTIPPHCRNTEVGPHPVEGVRTTAFQAARAVASVLSPAWVDWKAREAALHRLGAQVDRYCGNSDEPLPKPALVELSVAVVAAEEPLRSEPTGIWMESSGQVRMAPAGLLTRVLVFDASEGSPAGRMNKLAAALPLHRRR